MNATIADRMRTTNNRATGFDYLRLVLSSGVILWHTVMTSYGPAAQLLLPSWVRALEFAILLMFFMLSGFLVAGSLERCQTLWQFAGLRILRIVPALSMEVFLSALLLGPLFTTIALRDYFSDPMFSSYFLNIVGDIHFYLPGMFPDNPTPAMVNMQLWTIPYELYCYIGLILVAALGLVKRRQWLLIAASVLQVAFIVRGWNSSYAPQQIALSGNLLVLMFFWGVIFYEYRERIPYDRFLGISALVLMLALLSTQSLRNVAAIPAAYLTIYLGLQNPPRSRIVLSGDYSYGLYLYGFPLQQAVASFGPSVHHWYFNFLIAYPLALLCAVFSWWVLEKRALALRRFIDPKSWQQRSVAGHRSAGIAGSGVEIAKGEL
jgi:peptidoglycan/LPS O-acetylase OafA/YrhL